jgi:hypothetical protein
MNSHVNSPDIIRKQRKNESRAHAQQPHAHAQRCADATKFHVPWGLAPASNQATKCTPPAWGMELPTRLPNALPLHAMGLAGAHVGTNCPY